MSAPCQWFAVDVLIDAGAAEAVESALNNVECLGIETDTWKKLAGEPLRVSAFFDRLPDINEVEAAVRQDVENYGFPREAIKKISHRTIEQSDWLTEWKKHWKPVEVGRFVVAPPWGEIETRSKHLIVIEPNMAFGTGTHETTQLCLRAISELVEPGDSFFDVGTGTGILAIAAAKLGASPVMACDTDEDSITIARENARANGVGDNIDLRLGTILDTTPVSDFVCANLTLDAILPILPLLLSRSRNVLLLSGVLVQQQDDVATHFSKFEISDLKFEIAGEWLSVLIKK